MEYTLLDFVLHYVKNFNKNLIIIGILLTIGILIAIFRPTEYTSTAKVVAEPSVSDNLKLSSGINALKRFGINMGMGEGGIIPETFPEILTSNEVLYKVIMEKFYFNNIDTTLIFRDYIVQNSIGKIIKKYTLKLPQTLFRMFFPKPKLKVFSGDTKKILYVTEKDFEAITFLKHNVLSVEQDLDNSIISISTKTFDRSLAAEINYKIIDSFRERIQEIYDEKNKEDLRFIKERYREAENDLRGAEDTLTAFLLENSDPNTIQLQTELERLKRNVSFKTEIYNELKLKLVQTEIELKRNEPIVRIIERPVLPIEPSSLGRLSIILIFLFLALLLTLLITVLDMLYTSFIKTPNNREKIVTIKQLFISSKVISYFTSKRK